MCGLSFQVEGDNAEEKNTADWFSFSFVLDRHSLKIGVIFLC